MARLIKASKICSTFVTFMLACICSSRADECDVIAAQIAHVTRESGLSPFRKRHYRPYAFGSL